MSNAQLISEMRSAEKPAEKPLILVVDDESLICRTLCDVLHDDGYPTAQAATSPEALDKVRELSPPVVLLDIWMPGMDGIETLQRIKDVSPFTEVIMISGHATVSNALEATRNGAFDFLEKPLDVDNILLAVSRAIERRATLLDQFDVKNETTSIRDASSPGHAELDNSERLPLLSHCGVLSTGMKGKNLGQRTLKNAAILYGQGLHSGQKSGLVLEPLPLNSGIHFARIGGGKTASAFVDSVESTGFATTVRSGNTSAATIEHLMSALHAYRITNLLVKCNGEVPIFDGSSKEFCEVIDRIGVEEQGGKWFELAVDRKIELSGEALGAKNGSQEFISIEPAECFSAVYELDYPAPVGRQVFEFRMHNVDAFKREIAPARTFGFMKDIERLQKAGLAAGGRLDNFILIGSDRIINTELRFPEELARHKILDLIGDIFLLGRPIRAHIHARMTGHSDNVKLLSVLRDLTLSH